MKYNKFQDKFKLAVINAETLKKKLTPRIELELKINYANMMSYSINAKIRRKDIIMKSECGTCWECGVYTHGIKKGMCPKCYSKTIYRQREKKPGPSNALYKQYNHNAKKRNYVFELTFEKFLELIYSPCVYCGKVAIKGIERNGIDRVNNDIGYTKINCVSCCKICNRAKFIYAVDDFKKYAHRLSFFNDYKPNWVRNIKPQ